MTTELHPAGKWIADTRDGAVYLVARHEDGFMLLEEYGGSPCVIWSQDTEVYVELPAHPDIESLADKGYKLTETAADCSKIGNMYLWVDQDGIIVYDYYNRANPAFSGWRWLVERSPSS